MKKIILKETPEDFVVEEVINLDLKKSGEYLILKIIKKNLNTLDAVKIIQDLLKVPRNFISFAGSKDKRAVTTQFISVKGIGKEKIEKLKHNLINFEFVGCRDKPISLGTLIGNKFTISLDFKPKNKIKYIVNYFGEQRFSKNNALVGKLIIMKKFEKACELLDDYSVKNSLKENPHDFIGAIKKLDKKLISLYINSYQSYLWNKAVVEYLKLNFDKKDYCENDKLIFLKPSVKVKRISIPLVSFETEFSDKNIEKIYNLILKSEGVELQDFLIRQFPEQLPVTVERNVFADVKNFCYFDGKIKFELPKGSYATILIKTLGCFE